MLVCYRCGSRDRLRAVEFLGMTYELCCGCGGSMWKMVEEFNHDRAALLERTEKAIDAFMKSGRASPAMLISLRLGEKKRVVLRDNEVVIESLTDEGFVMDSVGMSPEECECLLSALSHMKRSDHVS